jgi:hypothetical protein
MLELRIVVDLVRLIGAIVGAGICTMGVTSGGLSLVALGAVGGGMVGSFYGLVRGMIAPKNPDVIYRGR